MWYLVQIMFLKDSALFSFFFNESEWRSFTKSFSFISFTLPNPILWPFFTIRHWLAGMLTYCAIQRYVCLQRSLPLPVWSSVCRHKPIQLHLPDWNSDFFSGCFFLRWHIRHLGCSSLEKRPWVSHCADSSTYQPCASFLWMSCLKWSFFFFFKSSSKVEDIHFFLWNTASAPADWTLFLVMFAIPGLLQTALSNAVTACRKNSINDYVTALSAGKILLSWNIFEVIQPVSTSSSCVKWVAHYSVRV